MDGTETDFHNPRYWLALASVPGVAGATARQLVEAAGSPAALLTESPAALAALGLPAALVDSLRRPDWQAVDAAEAWQAGAADRQLLTWADPAYPACLQQLPDPPLVLFVQGAAAHLQRPQLAVVGSRNPSADGRGLAYDFSRRLSRCGLTVTSGLAMGIDAAAHEGALTAQSPTVAVAGCGPDRTYPKKHAELAECIRHQGALVSELFPGTPPLAANFPRRNRIISGLSLGVLVVEAAIRSGSLITARMANEQGREVFAIPGSIHTPQARGCHHLIRQGARLVESEQDILEELAPLLPAGAMPAPVDGDLQQDLPLDELSGDARHLLALISGAPVSVDSLVERSGLTADAVSAILLSLELRGLVATQPGGTYSRLRRDNT